MAWQRTPMQRLQERIVKVRSYSVYCELFLVNYSGIIGVRVTLID
jgi:hypothetical protein